MNSADRQTSGRGIIVVKEVGQTPVQPTHSNTAIRPQGGLIIVREAENGTIRKNTSADTSTANSTSAEKVSVEHVIPTGEYVIEKDHEINSMAADKLERSAGNPAKTEHCERYGKSDELDKQDTTIKNTCSNTTEADHPITVDVHINQVDTHIISCSGTPTSCETDARDIVLNGDVHMPLTVNLHERVETCQQTSCTSSGSRTILVKEATNCHNVVSTAENQDLNFETQDPSRRDETKKTEHAPIADVVKKSKKLWTPFQKRRKSDTRSDSKADTSGISKVSINNKSNNKNKIAKEKGKESINPVAKRSQFERFRSYINSKLKFVPDAKTQQNPACSLKGAIGFATTGAALILIDECKEDVVATSTSTTTLQRAHSTNSLVNQFDLIDSGIKHEATMSDSGNGVNDGFKIPSPDFNPINMPYDSIDNVVEEMFKTMKKVNSWDDVR